MVVEISKAQKEVLSEKIKLCVDFLKNEVQHHLVSTDKISVSVGVDIDLFITSKDLYVVETRLVPILFMEPSFTRTMYLEKPEKKSKKKKYICEDYPELAVEFLKNWEKAKAFLMEEVAKKVKKVDDLNSFIDNFQL